ncbi:pantoate--beta-alanine ligase [Caldalkalibacillus salinus]|uniref:pantoate--beta-alanine ligase n=1 Tax=Caldalkalibacillus salinus TaxID=2803787 RepID=UPI001921EC28
MTQVIYTIEEWRTKYEEIKQLKGSRIGFVPTMGYLHDGHLSLACEAKQNADVVVMSIFINPLQFGPEEDYEQYPRDLERDVEQADRVGVDYIFAPSVEEMYPTKPKTTVKIQEITERLCGASRPGHFDGVGTVVSKLFHIIQPDTAYFGQKDAQQVAVIQQMVQDLNFPVHIVTCPTFREDDGLAMSSRNVYLKEKDRQEAVVLFEALQRVKTLMLEGERDVKTLLDEAQDVVSQAPSADIDYIHIYRYPSLEDISYIDTDVIVALAVRIGGTRLIDNMIVEVVGKEVSFRV